MTEYEGVSHALAKATASAVDFGAGDTVVGDDARNLARAYLDLRARCEQAEARAEKLDTATPDPAPPVSLPPGWEWDPDGAAVRGDTSVLVFGDPPDLAVDVADEEASVGVDVVLAVLRRAGVLGETEGGSGHSRFTNGGSNE